MILRTDPLPLPLALPLARLNRTSVSDNGQVTTYGSNGMNQYTTMNGAPGLYDQNFNLYYLGGWRYDYDADKHLLLTTGGGNTGQFVYDGLGRCVKRIINGVTTVITYDDWKPIMEWDVSGNLSALNVYGPGADEILYRYLPSGNQRFRYHHDMHGNVTFLLDWSGTQILERYTYDAFGLPTIMDANGTEYPYPHRTSAVGNRFMFQGREWLGEVGIYDYRHRYYDPGFGRFLQTDPTGFDAGDMNLFRYCGDDSVDRSDPMGLETEAELEQLSIRATLRAAKDYRTDNPEGLGRAVWGAHRRDGTGYDEFPAKATIVEGYVRYGSVKRWEGHEIEPTPDVDTNVYDLWGYVGHVHGRKGERAFSGKDGETAEKGVVVTRVDALDVDKYGHLKPGHTVKRAVARRGGKTETRDVYKEPNTPSHTATSAISSTMSDALNYAFMYMSFGGHAESVNRVGGPL